MDQKAPHVLGHEVSGRVIASTDERFPQGSLVFPHHHASCGICDACSRGDEVHCAQWKQTRLDPGGMAEIARVPEANLSDTHVLDDLRPEDAALVEPLACVHKSVTRSGVRPGDRAAVVGLGAMGLMHALLLQFMGAEVLGVEISAPRRAWAQQVGVAAAERETGKHHGVFVCPGTSAALRLGIELLSPGGTLVAFAPTPPGEVTGLNLAPLYFSDIRVVFSYSSGKADTVMAIESLRRGVLKAEQVVSHFISLNELPAAYEAMKKGEILKPMVMFG